MIQRDINIHQTVNGIRLFFNTLDYRTQHFHRDLEVMWALENGFEIQAGNDRVTAEEGGMLLINSNQPHEIRALTHSCTMLGVQISPELIAGDVPEFESIRFEEYHLDHLPPEDYRQIESLFLDVAAQYLTRPDYYELYCRSRMQLFLHLLLTRLPQRELTEEQCLELEQTNERLSRLIQFVDQNYMKNIRLSDFAESEGRSLSRISHFVQSTMNQSFREYVDLVRYNAACRMMTVSRDKMLDICMASGFSDYRYFSKAFVSRTGMTPEAYRRVLLERAGDETSFKHSIHSREKFYTPEQSVRLLARFREKYGL